MGVISISIFEALPTTEPPDSGIHSMALRGGLIKKKESSWVKLKVLPTNVGRPNKR